jgi:hypothetical protein
MSRAAFHGIEVTKDGREAGAAVNLASFLWAQDQSIFATFMSFAFGGLYYIGLLPIACIVWGFFGARSTAFYVFIASAVLLTWFALGGLLSLSLFYYVPFVSKTHYLWMGYYLMRAPLLLAAAAAWDVFSPTKKSLKSLFLIPVFVMFLMDLSLQGDRYTLANPYLATTFARLWWPAYKRLAFYAVFVGCVVIAHYGSRRQAILKSTRGIIVPLAPSIAVALLAAMFVDVFGYSYRSGLPDNKITVSYQTPAVTYWRLADTAEAFYQAGTVQRLKWQAERLDAPTEERQQVALQLPSYYHTYAFAQFDPCEPTIKPPTILNTSIAKLLSLRDKGDGALRTILGCQAPKMRLVRNARYVADDEAAALAVQAASDLVGTAIVEIPQTLSQPAAAASPMSVSPGTVAVTAFSSNALAATVHVDDPNGAWLVYADAYDPRWHAWVNELPTPILPAYVGLKAVRVPKGDSVVRMEFRGASTIAMTILALIGAMCSLSLLIYCATCGIRGFPSHLRVA